MKKIDLIIIVAILAATVVATASVTAEDADARVVNINTDGYMLTVDLDDDALEARLIRVATEKGVLELRTVENDGKTYSVTAVHDCILQGNETVTNVRLPNVVTVGDNAFSGSVACYINLDSARDIGSYAFEGCENLYLWIPSCANIARNAFYDTDIERVMFGHLESVDAEAFPGFSFYDLNGSAVSADADHLADRSFAKKTPYSMYEEPDAGYAFSSGGLDYMLISSRSAKVVGGAPSADGTLSIPNMTHFSSLSGNHTVFVTEIGDRAFFGNKDIRCLQAPYVSKIGTRAFYECTNMVSAEFSDSNGLSAVTTFSKLSFYRCTGLTELTIPATAETIDIYAFRGCTGLASVDIVPGSASVDHDAFYGFSFYMPDGTTKIACDSDAFPGHQYTGRYSKMVQIGDVLPGEIVSDSKLLFEIVKFDGISGTAKCIGVDPQYNPYAFYGIPNKVTCKGYQFSVTSIAPNAFKENRYITTILLPSTLESIGFKSFAACSSLESISFTGQSLESIGGYAFYRTALREIVLPEGLESIAASAFSKLKPGFISIPGSVSSIGSDAFSGMNLYDFSGEVQLQPTPEDMAGYSFILKDGKYVRQIPVGQEFEVDGLLYKPTYYSSESCYAELSGYVAAPADLVVPASVTYSSTEFVVDEIGDKAFYQCSAVKSLSAESVRSIGNKAFASSGIKSVSFGDELNYIGPYAFYKCRISELILPDSIESIGSSAFSGCTSLERVSLKSEYEYGSNVFHGLSFFLSDGTTPIHPGDQGFGYHTYTGSDRNLVMEAAEEGKVFENGCLKYRIEYYNGNGGEATVIGFASGKAAADVEIPREVEYDMCSFTVREIADRAFYGDQTVKSVSMPYIEIIGSRAFTKSTLESMVLDYVFWIKSHAFYNCPLTAADLPDAMESIDAYAFYGCKSLTSMHVPECEYGSYAFRGIQFYYADGARSLGPDSPDFPGHTYTGTGSVLVMEACLVGDEFDSGSLKYRITNNTTAALASVVGYADGCSEQYIAVPERVSTGGASYSVSEIADRAFYGCKSIKAIDMKHVNVVGNRAFASSTLEYVELPRSNGIIKDYAFFGCPLKSLYVPEGVQQLCKSAFSGCTSITRVTMYASCIYGSDVFHGLRFYMADGETLIPESSYPNMLTGNVFEGADRKLVKVLVVNVGDTFNADVLKLRVTYASEFEYRAEVIGFADDKSSTVVSITPYANLYTSNGHARIAIEAIGERAFYRSSVVEEIHASGPIAIGERAFTSCSKLRVIDLDGGDTSLGKYAFYGCANVVRVDFNNLTSINAKALDGFEFHDYDGSVIDKDVDSLSYHDFRGEDSAHLIHYL